MRDFFLEKKCRHQSITWYIFVFNMEFSFKDKVKSGESH